MKFTMGDTTFEFRMGADLVILMLSGFPGLTLSMNVGAARRLRDAFTRAIVIADYAASTTPASDLPDSPKTPASESECP